MTIRTLCILGFALLSTPLAACASADDIEQPDAEDLSEEAITNYGAKVVGAYVASQGHSAIKALTLRADRTFEASVTSDCSMDACPKVSIRGRYRVGSKNLYLDQLQGGAPSRAYGKYAYTLTANEFTLRRTGERATTMRREPGIVPSDATKLGASAKGGMTRPLPGGSTCNPNDSEYSLDLRTRVLTYTRCAFDERLSSFDFVRGTMQLSSPAVAGIRAEYGRATISTRDVCGMDKPESRITVSNPSGTKTYTDEFYSCRQGRDTYVTNVDAILAAFDAVVPPSL